MMNSKDMGSDMTDIIDLTKVLDENLPIYTSGTYSDPPLQIEPWCTIQQQGYKVSRLLMGTQSGTHIDAPVHFVADGATLEALPIQALIGRYLWVDLNHFTQVDLVELMANYKEETLLFLTSSGQTEKEISEEVFSGLLKLPCIVWVSVYGVQVVGHDPLYFHRALSEAGKYLIEDVDEIMARRVNPGGEMIALPLRLRGVSGSPCRVVVIQGSEQNE
jgi:arylformamidase